MKNQLEGTSIYTNIEDLYDEVRKTKGKGLLSAINTGAPQSRLNDDHLMETIDSKINNVYEKLRNDNWVIWKESLKLAEKQFNE